MLRGQAALLGEAVKPDPHLWLLRRLEDAEAKRARVWRETERDYWLLTRVLLPLLVFAPELVMLGRRLFK